MRYDKHSQDILGLLPGTPQEVLAASKLKKWKTINVLAWLENNGLAEYDPQLILWRRKEEVS